MQVQERVINGFRISPQQKRVWSLQQDSLAYCVQACILLEGNLKKDILKSALEQVISRQDILRTDFLKPTGFKTPVQVINEKKSLSWQEVDLSDAAKGCWQSHRDSQAQFNQVESLLMEARLISSNFEQGLVLHSSLINLSANQHILLVNLPALCADSYTIKILVQEISQCYKACCQGIELPDEEIVQYLQFSEWQNELLEDADAELGQKYWAKYNLSALLELSLPFENKLLADSHKFQVGSYEFKIDSSLIRQIEAIAQKYDLSIANFLLTCWQVLLWRFTDQSNLVIGMAANGRKYEELATVIGLLTKYLPLSANLEESLSFRQVLQEISKSVQEVEEWQEYFSWQILAESQNINPDSVYLPFSFEFQAETAKYSADNITFSIYKQFACTDRFKVRLSCIQQEDSLAAAFDYDANLYSVEDIKRLAEHFQTLLESAIANPESEISKLGVLSDRHFHQLLLEFNNVETLHPTSLQQRTDKCFHQLFAEQVQRRPDSIAVVFEDQKLTYAELNARANQLAHYLQKLGVKPEVLVGICVERSLEVIVGLLGILKAGGAYLPLDPALPAENINLRLEDAQTSILLTQQELFVETFHTTSVQESSIQVIYLDQDWDTIATESTENPQNDVKCENLAYVIYTSGSTGKPKGVAIEHQQLLNYLNGILERLHLPPGESFASVSTIAADLGNTAIFPALCTGGCLHIVAKERASDPEALATYFNHHPIDCLKIVPSHLETLLTSSQFKSILPRQKLILGGEAVPWKLIEKIQQLAPECTIINHYGPTEATVGVLTYTVDKDSDNRQSATVPLGRPIANTQIYLLDKHLQPVPIGVKGELYIGGTTVARGYLNRPELTREKFIPNLFNHSETSPLKKGGWGDRLYKTGDLARYLPDSNIEFLGRADNQVKVRGYRIELEEIAAVLSQYPDVSQAIVIQREDIPGDQRLVAYIVTNVETLYTTSLQNSTSSLRDFLKAKLPDYMIPSAFVVLKSLPLTANGKIDRQALPAPAPSEKQAFVSPRTPIEEVLARIWAELLGLQRVSVEDNFFELGGHSLLMTQLVVRVRDTFEIDLPLSVVFETPTIAGLAASIDSTIATGNVRVIASQLDLNAEAVLDSAIRAATTFTWSTTEPTAIFLTGATGFLGTFLLQELLTQTQADIYCLVRANSDDSAKNKIQSSLESYELWQESFSSRIIPVLGELSKPLLGLSPEQFQSLANQIDIIYHNGALVNFVYPYSALKPANVLGTQEILRLASQSKLKPVHFVSTTNAISPAKGFGVKIIRENDSINPDEVMETGYAKSKWVAEKLINIARDRGIPVCIYRPGRIVWHSETGVGNKSDNTFRMLKGCIQMGSVPQRDAMVNLIPVDFVSKAIAHLSRQKESLGKAFHIVNPNPAPFKDIVNWVRSYGYPLREVSDEQWREELHSIVGKSPDNPLYPLVPFWSKPPEANTSSPLLKFDCQNTLNGLVETNINCPPVSVQLLTKFLSYLIKKGVLSSPRSNQN
ncbi:amino acid adenylation domain protein [Crinalium epipsammum PCC 9333]|uniref:Amino acid adenylation domain protein n=1 Tax=Crinalium epipsammum PCC 9333 TaxID=1173022 RepID=K9VTK1_9CYAN|nr:non-ribosomal peptide synthetase [Crinalium epipsammum]AFZ11271.1 amino acid adenylation domain protein [Crinalium epipsammum PCC 9333]